jgi:hypothetical protein
MDGLHARSPVTLVIASPAKFLTTSADNFLNGGFIPVAVYTALLSTTDSMKMG